MLADHPRERWVCCKSNDCELSAPREMDGRESTASERDGVIHKVNRLCACAGSLTAGEFI